MPGRVLIVAPQITPESLRGDIADGARAEGLEAESLARAASENACGPDCRLGTFG